MLERIEGNGVRTIIVETASCFARDLMVQEVGHAKLRDRGIDLIATDNPGSFIDDTPTAKLVRQLLAASATAWPCSNSCPSARSAPKSASGPASFPRTSCKRRNSRTSGDRATCDPTRFRTIQVCPRMFTITYSLPPPIGIGLAGGIWVAVKVTESGPSGGRL
jgi:hypothetical protein